MTTIDAPKAPPTAAERMRTYRARRRRKLRCVRVTLANCEIDCLVRRGHLQQEDRDDPKALEAALCEFLLVALY
jgi:hypothetical protein